MPGDEAAVAVSHCLREGITERGLSTEIHIAEQELAEKVCGDSAGLFALLLVGDHGVVGAPVEEAYREAAEVVMGREKGRGLRRKGCWGGGRFRKGGGVCLV